MNLSKDISENVKIKNYNTYKIDCIAKYFIEPKNIDDLKKIISYINKKFGKYLIIGKGSNIILPDYYDGTVISLNNLNTIEINKNQVIAYSGITLNTFINECINNNLQGLENIYGIPGTLGGALVQNAGCYGTEISNYIESVCYLKKNNIYEINKDECKFSYRNSIFKKNKDLIILYAKFNLNIGNKEEMKQIIKKNLEKRRMSQPLEYPNAGSVFKNPENNYAAKIIEDNNLKGYHIKDAYISSKHANFIINKGNATSKDIIDLINFIKKTIYINTNINLELEQEIIK